MTHVRSKSICESTCRMRWRELGTIDPSINGCFTKFRAKRRRLSRRRRGGRISRARWGRWGSLGMVSGVGVWSLGSRGAPAPGTHRRQSWADNLRPFTTQGTRRPRPLEFGYDDGFGIRPDDLEGAGGSVPDPPGAADDVAAQGGTARPSDVDVRGAGAAGDAKPDRALTAVSVERIQAAIATVLRGLAGREYEAPAVHDGLAPRPYLALTEHRCCSPQSRSGAARIRRPRAATGRRRCRRAGPGAGGRPGRGGRSRTG